MNIQSTDTNSVVMCRGPKNPKNNNFVNRIKQKILDTAPDAAFKDEGERINKWDKFNEFMAKPAQNRLIMGATAMLMQPAIDACNKKVDDETRQISICRTIAKIIAGTTVGVLVRGAAYEGVKKMTDTEGSSKYSKALLPDCIEYLLKNPKRINNYRNALSTLTALAMMCVTNFLLDAPLTAYLTNKFTAKAKLMSEKKEAANDRLA